MVGRFLLVAMFLIVATGLTLHFGFEIPYLPAEIAGWVGHLPGDLIVKKDGATIYLPLTTSLIGSGVITGLLSLFSKNGK